MIRCATDNDIKKIRELGVIFNSNFINTYSVEEYIKNKNYIILVNEDECVNAFLIVYRNIDYFELEAIFVDRKKRKQGIANNLIEYFIEKYTDINNGILLEVAINNEPAINLYKKFNFEIINIRKNYYNSVDAYVMKKVI